MEQFDYQTINLQHVRAQMLQFGRELRPVVLQHDDHNHLERDELEAVYQLLHTLHHSMAEGLQTLEVLLGVLPDVVVFPVSVPAERSAAESGAGGSQATIPLDRLSEREHQVLEMFARGYSYAEAAELLDCKLTTIQTHTKRIYRKLKVHSRSEAVFEARQLGIVT